MKKIAFCIILLISSLSVFSQNYTPVDNGSSVKFNIKNFGFNVSGTFTGLKGKIVFNPNSIGSSYFNVTVETATVNTGNGSRDGHLKKEEYFDVEKHPTLSFVSTKISNSNKPGMLVMEGNITIKGVTKSISFPFTANPLANGYKFAGEFKLNRRDFNVGSSSMVLSDNLTVSLSVFAKNN
ncbi:YceI family protein [soil metagenome]